MIFDKLSQIKKYKGISENLDKAINTIIKGDYINSEIGKYEIDGSEVFYMIQKYNTKEIENCTFETHHNYADIQIVLSGKEKIGYSDYDNLEITTPFIIEKDVEKQKGNHDFILKMDILNFALFFPNEPHMPCIANKEIEEVKKAVFKIKL